MSENIEKKIKYCVYCGVEVPENKTYCPKCGKLIVKIDSKKTEQKPAMIQKMDISRKCPGCGSIITSTIIDQCPICDTPLEKISDVKKVLIQKKPGLIFTEKKLVPEEDLVLKKDVWNLKEGINVFLTSIYVLIIIYFLLYAFISFQADTTTIDVSIQQILLFQIPDLIFGVYPIWYIYNKKHHFNKLGFKLKSKKILIALILGAIGTADLLVINFFSDFFIDYLSDVGFNFLQVTESISEQNQVIKEAELLWKILFIIVVCIGTISSEIVFRGVLHNTLKQKFQSNFYVILIVALVYSFIVLIFSFQIGLILFLANFLSFVILGLLYEWNGNILNTMIANVAFNILIIFLFYF
ncbi:MAG: type II CAAX prenyl endopeptidase Rce1 family protein [Promethearchaeota archaeon]